MYHNGEIPDSDITKKGKIQSRPLVMDLRDLSGTKPNPPQFMKKGVLE